MNTNEVMQVAIFAGEILLKSGAEVYRVEETITRISRSFNFECETFVMPTGIFISSNGKGNEFVSYVRRIKGRSLDLHRIELINSFSRGVEVQKMTFEEAMKALKDIEKAPYFSFPVRLISAGMTALTYTLLFKATLWESVVAFFISMAIYIFNVLLSRAGSFQFLQNLLSGALAGGVTIFMNSMFPVLNVDKILIGAIMILVPGMAITNGIKDALYGDIVSSISRIGEAVFVVTAVGIGVAVTLVFGIGLV